MHGGVAVRCPVGMIHVVLTERPLLLGGGGVVAEAVAEAARPRRIAGTTRNPAAIARIAALGIDPVLLDCRGGIELTDDLAEADVVVTFPPDGESDSQLAPQLERCRRIVYVSSTGVYGDLRGRIDNDTPATPNDETGRRRLAAEDSWRSIGATVVRAPGIYGRGRGLHRLIASGAYRLPGDGSGVVSRIHVEDLALVLLAALDRGAAGATLVVGDLCAVPQRAVVAWLCDRLGREMPPSVRLEDAPRTLRGSRSVDPSGTLKALEVTLRYPTYREGFESCLESDGFGPGRVEDRDHNR